MRAIFAFVGSVVLVGVVTWAAASLIPACGANNRIASTWVDWCPVNKAQEKDDRLTALTQSNRDLADRIFQTERELALMQCVPEPPQQSAQLTPPPIAPPRIDEEDWNDQDIGLLDGCWDLDSRFVTTNRQTGAQTRYNRWTMCFDGNGNGRETMQADNGNNCSGPVRGAFDGAGKLVIEEPGNLQCSDGGYIYRLRSSCTLNPNGTASCVVTQPEVGSSTTVEFRRSARGN
ncbi:MAG: hypothetical protein AAF754_09935 [Pseudomonadota bacterium]